MQFSFLLRDLNKHLSQSYLGTSIYEMQSRFLTLSHGFLLQNNLNKYMTTGARCGPWRPSFELGSSLGVVSQLPPQLLSWNNV